MTTARRKPDLQLFSFDAIAAKVAGPIIDGSKGLVASLNLRFSLSLLVRSRLCRKLMRNCIFTSIGLTVLSEGLIRIARFNKYAESESYFLLSDALKAIYTLSILILYNSITSDWRAQLILITDKVVHGPQPRNSTQQGVRLVDSMADEVYRQLLLFNYALSFYVLSMLAGQLVSGWLGRMIKLGTVAMLYGYLCFEPKWRYLNMRLESRLKFVEKSPCYHLGFGMLPSILFCTLPLHQGLGVILISAVLHQANSLVVFCQRFERQPIPIFWLAMQLNSLFIMLLMKKSVNT